MVLHQSCKIMSRQYVDHCGSCGRIPPGEWRIWQIDLVFWPQSAIASPSSEPTEHWHITCVTQNIEVPRSLTFDRMSDVYCAPSWSETARECMGEEAAVGFSRCSVDERM